MASANREYKDRLFHFIFSEESHKDWALSLYNAVNHTHYTDTDLLTFNTIREVIYLERWILLLKKCRQIMSSRIFLR